MDNETRHTELNEAKWDKWAPTLDDNSWRNRYLRRAQSAVISLLDLEENDYFLDVGCGTGWALGRISTLLNGRGQFYGIDLSSKMIDRATENFKEWDNFHFVKANAEAIPIENDFFDIIICTNSFHHYFDPLKALSEMRRLLKPGGKVYILDPTADSWFSKLIGKISKSVDPAHVKTYSSKEFQDLFAKSGLEYINSSKCLIREKVHIARKQPRS